MDESPPVGAARCTVYPYSFAPPVFEYLVNVPKGELHRVTKDPDYSPGYLYGINPHNGRKHANALLKQLEAVIDLVAAIERQSLN
jgi:hypothetical protein